jgi:transcriptional regulator
LRDDGDDDHVGKEESASPKRECRARRHPSDDDASCDFYMEWADTMYVPEQFAEHRLPVLQKAIASSGLANLITMGADGMIASPVPLLLDPDAGPHGTLIGHLARANPQWRASDTAVQALAIFMGPDAYVSPSYYETKRETGKVVPTWNYVTIHAYGTVTFSDDTEELLHIVTRLTAKHEAGRAVPWAVSDAPPAFTQSQLKGIVALRMPIDRLQGKWKMSQNRTTPDRTGVVAGLEADGKHDVAAIVAGRKDVLF